MVVPQQCVRPAPGALLLLRPSEVCVSCTWCAPDVPVSTHPALTGRLSRPSMTFCGIKLKLRTTCTGAKPSPARPAASGRTSCRARNTVHTHKS